MFPEVLNVPGLLCGGLVELQSTAMVIRWLVNTDRQREETHRILNPNSH